MLDIEVLLRHVERKRDADGDRRLDRAVVQRFGLGADRQTIRCHGVGDLRGNIERQLLLTAHFLVLLDRDLQLDFRCDRCACIAGSFRLLLGRFGEMVGCCRCQTIRGRARAGDGGCRCLCRSVLCGRFDLRPLFVERDVDGLHSDVQHHTVLGVSKRELGSGLDRRAVQRNVLTLGDVADQLDRLGLCVYDCGDCVRRNHELCQKLFVEFLHPLDQIAELLLFRSLEILQKLRIQCVVLLLRSIDRFFVFQRCVRDARKLGDGRLHLVDCVKASKFLAEVCELLRANIVHLGTLQSIHCLLGLYDVLTIILAVFVGQIVGVRERIDLRVHFRAAAACADDVKLIPCTDVLSGFRGLVVHRGPDGLAAANVDGIAAYDRDSLRTLVVAAALGVVGDLLIEEALDKIVLVRRVRKDGEIRGFVVDHDGVGIRSARLCRTRFKLRRKNERLVAIHDLERLERRIRVVERTAKVFAKTRAGIHHMDHVAVRQLNIGVLVLLHCELRKAEVHEEAVERAHPTRLVTAIELAELTLAVRDAGKIGNTELRAAGSSPFVTVICQRAENDRHHGVLVANGVAFPVDDGILDVVIRVVRVGVEALRRAGIGGVLNNDLDRADVVAGVEALVIGGVTPAI